MIGDISNSLETYSMMGICRIKRLQTTSTQFVPKAKSKCHLVSQSVYLIPEIFGKHARARLGHTSLESQIHAKWKFGLILGVFISGWSRAGMLDSSDIRVLEL